jgi:murein DD-endopeptidase MepM/ murein hydrolase activator NlpD
MALFLVTKQGLRKNSAKIVWSTVVLALILGLVASPSVAQTIDFRTSEEIKKLNLEITQKADQADDLGSRADQYADLIAEKQAEGTSLENELSIIENRITKIGLDIERKQVEVEAANLKIDEIALQIGGKTNEIDFKSLQLEGLIREIYRQDQRSNLEILVLNDSLSEFFGYIKQLEEVQFNMQVTLAGVKESKRELEIDEHSLEKEKADLQNLLLELEIESQKQGEEKAAQERLIDQTELSERSFQDQLSEIRFQQRVADEEIEELERQVKEKLRQAQLRNPSIQINPGQLLWPVPNQGITTYFHDPSYPFRHIVGEHSGLDLRTLINGSPRMGLALRAPASGIVLKTIRNGRFTGNAVFLSHGDMMTVYLHMSEIYVQPDAFVNIGETFGLTGGAPGHPGAGLSSGPHLHFEVRQNGIPIDPCSVLTPSC